MATPDRIISLRFVDGVNRIEDARITDAGSWWTTENLYGRNPGVLAKRPGSKIIVNNGGTALLPVNTVKPPADRWNQPDINIGAGEVKLNTPTATYKAATDLKPQVSDFPDARKGSNGPVPIVVDVPLPGTELPVHSPVLTYVAVPPTRVSYLQRVYFGPGKKYWVGVLDYGQAWTDQLFYINSANELQLIATGYFNDTNAISSAGALFQIIPYRSGGADVETELSPEYSYWAIGTNQLDAPFVLKQGANGVEATALQVGRSSEFSGTPETLASTSLQRILKVQAITTYNGSVVYGGYRMKNLAGGDTSKFDHYITFSDPGEPHKLATTDGIVSSIRIGDTESEPVTALATSTVPTDSMGIKGQLVVFTEKRVVVFDGLPPVSESPLGTNFQSTVMQGIGCNAPRTVVQTPSGVVFLGSDGRVYLINGLAGLVPIGTAAEAFFKYLTPTQQRKCHAFWDPEGFYKLYFPRVVAVGKQGWIGLNDYHRQNPQTEFFAPELQMWADLRTISGQATDLGVRWFGPMTGSKHACVGVANDKEDKGEIYAGSAIDGSIYQIALEGYTVDPLPEAPGTLTNIDVAAITGLFDLGDAHVDKLVTALSYGVGTDRNTTVECSIVVNGTRAGASSQESFTEAVSPGGDVLSDDFVLGTSSLSSGDDFTLVTERPSTRKRGKTFRFTFAESGGARLFFSDFGFRAIMAQRRI